MNASSSGSPAEIGRPEATGAHALAFRLGDRDLAAPTAFGSGVVEIESWTRVPTAPPYVLGIASAQGRMLTLLDLRSALGLAQRPWSLPLRALALGGRQARVAVAIDRPLSFGQIVPIEEESEEAPGLSGFGLREVDIGGQRATLVDFPALLDSLRTDALNQKKPDRPTKEGQTT